MDVPADAIGERALVLGAMRSLTGIMTTPAGKEIDTSRPALIILNAGLVHRVGPNRLHVHVARRLAERGFVSVRFDFSGLGESLSRSDSLPYAQSAVLEVGEVMDAVTELVGIRRFCLMGLSSGALVSIESALADRRVVGAAIVNPHGFADLPEWVTHVENLSESRTYVRNLLDPYRWGRLLTGKTNYQRLAETFWYRVVRRKPKGTGISAVVHRMQPKLTAFLGLDIHILLLFSEKDRGLVNFEQILGHRWQRKLRSNVEMVVLLGANHTFAGPVQLKEAVASIEHWMTKGWTGTGTPES